MCLAVSLLGAFQFMFFLFLSLLQTPGLGVPSFFLFFLLFVDAPFVLRFFLCFSFVFSQMICSGLVEDRLLIWDGV